MKILKYLLITIVAIVIILGAMFVYGVYINPKSPKGVVQFENADTEIEINYYRPYKKDRLIFGTEAQGALLHYGKYWRLGANFSTTFEVNRSILFANQPLQTGKYRMYAVPYEDRWEVTLNSEAGSFGATTPDYSKDLFSVKAYITPLDAVVEQLTIEVVEDENGINLRMKWDKTLINIPIK
jgi:hypothetical protein